MAYNIETNGFGNVPLLEAVAGGEEGKQELWSVATNSGFATFVKGLTKDKWKGDWQAQEILIRPLKKLLAECELGQEVVMKIDVEGFEDRVLLSHLDSTEPGQ